MNTKDLHAFQLLYEEKNISAAAKKLFITPQGLSLTLKKLEAEMEAPLFLRTNHGIIPTELAHALYLRASSIADELEHIKERSQNYTSGGRYHLKIASTLGVMNYVTIRFIKEYRESHPRVHLTIVENPDRTVKERLLNNEAEIGFLAGPIDTTLFSAVPFSRHHHCLVIHREHPLASKRKISYMDLDGEPIALEGRDFMPYHNNINRFLRAGSHPVILMETTEIVSTHKIAASGEGIGLSVDFPAWDSPEPDTVIRPFEDMECIWETFLVAPAGQRLSAEAKDFIQYSLDWLTRNKPGLFHWPQEYEEMNEWYEL